jgi:hypothetical protein
MDAASTVSQTPGSGYAQLAALMGVHPELAIFRRFGALNATTLLHLQAELCELEVSLQQMRQDDANSGNPSRMDYNQYWVGLSESATEKDGNPEQWNTLRKIREKLVEYSK